MSAKHRIFLTLAETCWLFSIPVLAQDIPGTPVRTLITVESRHGNQPAPTVTANDVIVQEGNDHARDQVSGLMPFQGEHAGLELLILLDDGAGLGLSTQLNDIRSFITAQPESTKIAVGYMRNGTVMYTAKMGTDHATAAKTLRIPTGQPGASGSPYFSLTDAVKKWESYAERREVLMITDGIDRYGYGTGLDNPYVNQSISEAQKRGIVVYSLYTRGGGHFGHSYWRSSWGQNFLSQVSDRTGGDSFCIGFGNPVAFKPFLDELSDRLKHQYLLTFVAKPKDKAELRPIKISTEAPNADIAHADHVWVPAGK